MVNKTLLSVTPVTPTLGTSGKVPGNSLTYIVDLEEPRVAKNGIDFYGLPYI